MKRRTLQWNVIPDEGGQALTEFVIVIPIVLLFFFSMVQYFSIVQATQLGNYAAFEAARVYSVRGAVDTNAVSEATIAASLAMSPVARPVPGEIGGSSLSTISSAISDITSILSTIIGSQATDILEGYGMAEYVRYNSDLLGGSVSCSVTNFNFNSPTQVVVTINYPQPIYIPGLAELWKFVGNKANIYAGTTNLASGLTGIPKYLLPVYAGNLPGQSYLSDLQQYDSGAATSLESLYNNLASDLPTVLLPYVNVQSECAMGYYAWSGIVRGPDMIPNSQSTNDPLAQVEQTEQAQQAYSNAMENAKQACQNVTNAWQQYETAKTNYKNNTNSANLTSLQNAEETYSQDYYSNLDAGTTLTNDMNALNTDLQNEPSIHGSTPTVGGSTNASAFNGANSGSQTAPTVGGLNCPCTCPLPSSLSNN
jgi:hypothetical protein